MLIPAFNVAPTLAACLKSLRRQTEPDWECVLVDDGSDDDTPRIAERVAHADSRFAVVRQPHAGIVAALGAGLARCRGLFVARMDADDLMRRDRLALQAATLQADDHLSGVGCYVRIFPRRGLMPGRLDYERWLNSLHSAADVRRDAYVECPVAHPALMMRAVVLRALGYRDVPWPEDYDLVLRALAAGHDIGVVPHRLLAWRDGPSRAHRTDPRYGRSRFTACKAHFLSAGFLAGSSDYILWGYGATGRALRRALAENGKHPSHIVEIKRTRIGQRIHGAPVIEPHRLGSLRGSPIVVSVAGLGPRSEIRAALASMHFVEGADYVCAA